MLHYKQQVTFKVTPKGEINLMTTYAVTGVTGKFGKRALATLAQLVPDAHIVGLARNTDKASGMAPAGVEVRSGDYTDKAGLVQALTGVDKLLFVSSVPGADTPRQTQHQNVIDAAKEAGVGYIAYTSYPQLETAKSPLSEDHKYTEKAILAAGLSHSFLRNNWYLENELSTIQGALKGQPFGYIEGNGHVGWAAEIDYADAAAKVLTLDDPKEVYEFAGAPLLYADLAAIVKGVSDVPFDVQAESDVAFKQNLINHGLDAGTAAAITSMQTFISNGDLDEQTSDLTDVLGRPLTDLADVIKSYK